LQRQRRTRCLTHDGILTAIYGLRPSPALPLSPREHITGFFRAVADTMLVIVMVLRLAPIGVFASLSCLADG
jgi:hypothetical protein